MAADQPLQIALTAFQKTLNEDERSQLDRLLDASGDETVARFTAVLDFKINLRGQRSISSRLWDFLDSVKQFSDVVDQFVSSNPTTAALVWGSVRFAMLAITNLGSYYEQTTLLVMNLRNSCPRLKEYQSLFPHSKPLKTAIFKYFALVIDCFRKILEISRRPEATTRIIAIWRPFESEFADITKSLSVQNDLVRQEIKLASTRLIVQEQRAQSRFRRENRRQTHEVAQAGLRQRQEAALERLTQYRHLPPLKRAKKLRMGDTCKWIVSSDEFCSWNAAAQSSIFCCFGIMGSGKTVMSAYLYDHILCDPDYERHFKFLHFCQAEHSESLLARTMLASCLQQLLRNQQLSPQVMQLLEDAHHDAQDCDSLIKAMCLVLDKKHAVLVLDGIDHCAEEERHHFLRVLADLSSRSGLCLKIILTARPDLHVTITKCLQPMTFTTLKTDKIKNDIETYISLALKEKMENDQITISSSSLKECIEKTLLEKSHGMILWVSLQLEELSKQKTDADIRTTLENLPRDLPETYERAFRRILRNRYFETILSELRWIAAAKRPLSVGELREAIAIREDQEYRQTETYVNNESLLVSWCEGLIYLDEEDQTLHFIHPSVQEFLLQPARLDIFRGFHFHLRDADLEIGKACVTYLNFNDFQRQVVRSTQSSSASVPQAVIASSLRPSLGSNISHALVRITSRRIPQPPSSYDAVDLLRRLGNKTTHDAPVFAEYARTFWLFHTIDIRECSTNLRRKWRGLLAQADGNAMPPWSIADWNEAHIKVLIWITSHDHVGLADEFVRVHNDPYQDSQLLLAATLKESLPIIRYLLRDQPISGYYRTQGLIAMFENGSRKVIDFYVSECFADEDVAALQRASNGRESTPIQVACAAGHMTLVERLIAAGADVNAAAQKGYSGRTALQAACSVGYIEIVKLLIAAEGDINAAAVEYGGRTALQAACGACHTEIVKLLVAAGADVNAAAAVADGYTALQAACRAGCTEIVTQLLDAGANVNAAPVAFNGLTALQAACSAGHAEIVTQLLDAGADVNAAAAASGGRTALQAACEAGYTEIVKQLLNAGADVNAAAAAFDGRTALQAAYEAGHAEIVTQLLDAKADVNAPAAQGGYGRTALEAVSETGRIEIVKQLLAAGANVNAVSGANVNAVSGGSVGRTALEAASGAGYVEVVKQLLAAGANVNAESGGIFRVTALEAASGAGHVEVVEQLIAAGANVSATSGGSFGRTALEAASGAGHVEVVKQLIAAGANVNGAAGTPLRTPLEAASDRGHVEIVAILKNNGAIERRAVRRKK